MFASKTPRDLNHDPEPYACPVMRHPMPCTTDGPRFSVKFDPRPEFDHVQHNEPNPILVEFRRTLRNYVNKSLCLQHYIEYATWGEVYEWTSEASDHARKVLSRLAALQEVS